MASGALDSMGAAYVAGLGRFLNEDRERLIGELAGAASRTGHARHWHSQTHAWRTELDILKDVGARVIAQQPGAVAWPLLLEYEIPRRGRRIDVVLLGDGAVAVLEFKVGWRTFDAAGVWQVEEYALDL